jgi:hypothetical protein
MNRAEEIRNAEIERLKDPDLLRRIVGPPRDPALNDAEFVAFVDMLRELRSGRQQYLSRRQREWAEEVCRRITPIKAADVPRGREVETPAVLCNLPKAPPGRASNG